MKISLKIFIFTYCIIMMVSVVGGFALVGYLYHADLNHAYEVAEDNNENLYAYVASLDSVPNSRYSAYSMASFTQRVSQSKQDSIFIGNHEGWLKEVQLEGYSDLLKNQVISSVVEHEGVRYIQVTSRFEDIYIINYYDISNVIAQRDSNYNLYRKVIILISLIIAVVLYLFSLYITRPLVKVTNMARNISEGNYNVRVDADYKKMKSYEVAKLGETLNLLAEHTEHHIDELKEIAQKREDFVGNFTHEIKTPLTSIIGYADLLRTYDIEPEKRFEYSNFIYKEGKRLEQLSFNLLQLIVMNNTEFSFRQMNTKALFNMVKDDVRFLGEKYDLELSFSCEDAFIQVEPALITTAIINLVDNARKASKAGDKIQIIGKKQGIEYYDIQIIDEGCGIPKEELKRILEPFYMVDKSRARKQGGAGLGLALCNRIAGLHQGKLLVESTINVGTKVTIQIPIVERINQEDEEENAVWQVAATLEKEGEHEEV